MAPRLTDPQAPTRALCGAGKRHAHAAAAGEGGFLIFGGTRHEKRQEGQKFMSIHVLDDLWWYSIATNTWQLRRRAPPPPAPPFPPV